MASRYSPPRSAQESEEKKRRQEGEGNTGPQPPPAMIYRKPTIRMFKYKKDGYEFHDTGNVPLSPKAFHRLTKGKYKGTVGT
jgi:hypothetical protein